MGIEDFEGLDSSAEMNLGWKLGNQRCVVARNVSDWVRTFSLCPSGKLLLDLLTPITLDVARIR